MTSTEIQQIQGFSESLHCSEVQSVVRCEPYAICGPAQYGFIL